ncbi:LAQU0S15e01948g1_1 [Lachancea quebecensis]|uniref:Topoisomerase 1-associated factor 1 n=1 Tax=Lachancea quebecensis TaxID=1654605 RepID=A0A0P1KVN7_9SACH|nr:LAQU0S15e01948g1_1 [Lachancea quebecensis]
MSPIDSSQIPETAGENGGPERAAEDGQPAVDNPSQILKARIALLSTAIGGPDHSSEADPPPYVIGDDCLACLKDLKRWFKLVDDKQSRWDVAAAAAQYNILTDDLLPILINWDKAHCDAIKKAKKKGGTPEDYLANKSYHHKIALNALQLMVLMTWPLILTDQSTQNQVAHYSELKKSQVKYKKAILSAENGRVLRSAIRLAVEVIKTEKRLRTPRDNVVLRLVLNFFRNIVAIEPSDLTISSKKSLSKGINSTDMLPPSVSKDDVSLSAVVGAFQRNKVFNFLLTLSSSINQEFDAAFINVPLLELMFFLIKNTSHSTFFSADNRTSNKPNQRHEERGQTQVGSELSRLLKKEHEMKKTVVRNTSARHSRFGSLLSIQTSEHQRLTISGGHNILDGDFALQKMDSRKKWNKRSVMKDEHIEGLASNFLNFNEEAGYWDKATAVILKEFVDDFIEVGFNSLLRSVTDYFTTEEDKMVVVHQIQYLLFYSWFLKYQRLAKQRDPKLNFQPVLFALRDTACILVSQILRKAVEQKIWAVVHAGMIAFNEIMSTLVIMGPEDEDIAQFVKGQILQEERIKLLSSLPRTASNHSTSYIRSCVSLVHTLLKMVESDSAANDKETQESNKSARDEGSNFSLIEAERIAEEEGIEVEEALEIMEQRFRRASLDYNKVQKAFSVETTVRTYISFLQRFRDLEDADIKMAIQFLYRVFALVKEESLLYRIDFMVLLKDLLGPTGLSMASRSRKHVVKFADFYMVRLKERLKASPSWFVSILFPTIHEREAGHYQKYGEKLMAHQGQSVLTPSKFIEAQEFIGLSASALLDFKFGVLVSSLIDNEKRECVEVLKKSLMDSCDVLKSWLLNEVSRGDEVGQSSKELFDPEDASVKRSIYRDPDFRALLQLCGYEIPQNIKAKCVLISSTPIPELESSVNLLVKYLTNAFDTPNGLPSYSYLIRPNAQGFEDHSHYFINDDARIESEGEDTSNQDQYFKALETEALAKNLHSSKGVALKKRKKATRKDNANSKTTRQSSNPRQSAKKSTTDPEPPNKRQNITSAEYISDSDDSGDESMHSLFYENEMYMRFLLDKHEGQLPPDKFALFSIFSNERIRNGGLTNNDYSSLFDGPVPSLDGLKRSENSEASQSISNSAFQDNELPNLLVNQGRPPRDSTPTDSDITPPLSNHPLFSNASDNDNEEATEAPAQSRKRQRVMIEDDDD